MRRRTEDSPLKKLLFKLPLPRRPIQVHCSEASIAEIEAEFSCKLQRHNVEDLVSQVSEKNGETVRQFVASGYVVFRKELPHISSAEWDDFFSTGKASESMTSPDVYFLIKEAR